MGATEKYMNILGNEHSSNESPEMGTSVSAFKEKSNTLLLPETQSICRAWERMYEAGYWEVKYDIVKG